MFIKILGVDLLSVNSFEQAYILLKEAIQKGKPGYITLNNVHTVIETVNSSYYKDVISNSLLPLTDSEPLNVIFRFRGNKNAIRIFGPDFMENTIDKGQTDKLRHFFFGSSEETLKIIEKKIKTVYPETIIAGMISPPFYNFDNNNAFIESINKSSADIIWVALGAPKQEIWMYKNVHRLSRGVMIGVGAGFNYFAGNLKHAPSWMKRMALEWLFRLLQEPKRLWKRYLITNSIFIYLIILESLRLKRLKIYYICQKLIHNNARL